MKEMFMFTKDEIPSIKCPYCLCGYMMPVVCHSNSFEDKEVGQKNGHYLLNSDLICENDKCKREGVHVMAGYEFVEKNESKIYYSTTYIYPAPDLFELSDLFPDRIKLILKDIFLLFWVEPVSCGNKLRIAVELLLNDLDVRELKDGQCNKNTTLYKKLKDFEKNTEVNGFCFKALDDIRILGNISSHDNEKHVYQAAIFQEIMKFSLVLKDVYIKKDISKDISLCGNFSISSVYKSPAKN